MSRDVDDLHPFRIIGASDVEVLCPPLFYIGYQLKVNPADPLSNWPLEYQHPAHGAAY